MFTKKIVYLEPTDSLLEHAKTRHFSLIAIALGLHAPSEAAGRGGNRTFSEPAGEGCAVDRHLNNADTPPAWSLLTFVHIQHGVED